jgi:hypothetical protein
VHPKPLQRLLTAARTLFPGFSGSSLGEVAAHIGVEESAFIRVLPELDEHSSFDHTMVFVSLLNLVRASRIRELLGGRSEAELRQIAAFCRASDRWDQLCRGDALIDALTSVTARLHGGVTPSALRELSRALALADGVLCPEREVAEAFGQLEAALAAHPEQRTMFLDATWAAIEHTEAILESPHIESLLRILGDDGTRYGAALQGARPHAGHAYGQQSKARAAGTRST